MSIFTDTIHILLFGFVFGLKPGDNGFRCTIYFKSLECLHLDKQKTQVFFYLQPSKAK